MSLFGPVFGTGLLRPLHYDVCLILALSKYLWFLKLCPFISELFLPWLLWWWPLLVFVPQWLFSTLLYPSLANFPQSMFAYKCFADFCLISLFLLLSLFSYLFYLRASPLPWCQMLPFYKKLPNQLLIDALCRSP